MDIEHYRMRAIYINKLNDQMLYFLFCFVLFMLSLLILYVCIKLLIENVLAKRRISILHLFIYFCSFHFFPCLCLAHFQFETHHIHCIYQLQFTVTQMVTQN